MLRLPLSELHVVVRDTADGQIEKYIPPAALVLILYDTLLSTGDEITYVWSQKLGFSTVIYSSARYMTIIKFVLFDFVCSPNANLGRTTNILAVIGFQAAGATLLAKCYAVSARNSFGVVLLSLPYLTAFSIEIFFALFLVCEPSTRTPKILVIIDSVMTILFETGAVVLIFIYTWRVYRIWKTTNVRQDCGLSGLLINQGFLRFLLYFVENVVIIILSEVKAEWANVLTYSINVVAAVVLPLIMCRFILQLRKAATNNIGHSHLSVWLESVSELAGFSAAIRSLGRNIERDFRGDTVIRSLSDSLEDD
ncbi:hypothetical protein M422DRAFT_274201 [Sphaerobolus stellatus SS14]|uniref:DUF6533 domain-containing protein n=1 Tax=Sphaerobolus stellatus (strain SS14) TaxID=990650 RepID=A0A0C9UHS6_SPHS4|nr:hypothetical protein M422DRAFT_274201 [Sphaerobolus stellatus SS14]